MPKRSDYEFRQEASMSQQLANQDKIYTKLAGSDPQLSDSIGTLLILGEFGLIDVNNLTIKLLIAILDVLRKSRFATNEKSSDVTKLGLQMPKSTRAYGAEE